MDTLPNRVQGTRQQGGTKNRQGQTLAALQGLQQLANLNIPLFNIRRSCYGSRYAATCTFQEFLALLGDLLTGDLEEI